MNTIRDMELLAFAERIMDSGGPQTFNMESGFPMELVFRVEGMAGFSPSVLFKVEYGAYHDGFVSMSLEFTFKGVRSVILPADVKQVTWSYQMRGFQAVASFGVVARPL